MAYVQNPPDIGDRVSEGFGIVSCQRFAALKSAGRDVDDGEVVLEQRN